MKNTQYTKKKNIGIAESFYCARMCHSILPPSSKVDTQTNCLVTDLMSSASELLLPWLNIYY